MQHADGSCSGWFTASRAFITAFKKDHNIVYRAPTTSAVQLPRGVTAEGMKEAYLNRLAYTYHHYKVQSLRLVVNADETGLPLAGGVSTKVLAYRGAKKVTGSKTKESDKRQVTVMIGASFDGDVLKPTIVFAGPEGGDRTLSGAFAGILEEGLGDEVAITSTPSHWMTSKSSIRWVDSVLVSSLPRLRLLHGLMRLPGSLPQRREGENEPSQGFASDTLVGRVQGALGAHGVATHQEQVPVASLGVCTRKLHKYVTSAID